MEEQNYQCDVAFSFAGVDREIARTLANIATANGLRVFLDEEHLWESWGKNLNEYLGAIYDSQSQYCVVLISKDYCEKAYTNLERRRALDRALESKTEYILPVRLDDSWLDGLPRATAYVDLRQMPAIKVAELLVRKVKGNDDDVVIPDDCRTSKIVPTPKEGIAGKAGAHNQPLDFVVVDVANECKGWKGIANREAFQGLSFSGGLGWYEDPIFDITVLSNYDKPVILSAVGVEIVKISFRNYKILGGGGAEPIALHRTYKLPLPDLWQLLAELERNKRKSEQGAEDMQSKTSFSSDFEIAELAFCKLPDPILIESNQPYRFGLHLFDYVSLCPTNVELFFWAKTNSGEVRSERVTLTYTIGSQIPQMERYIRLLNGALPEPNPATFEPDYIRAEKQEKLEGLAYELWERAGRPAGREAEFWRQAETELPVRQVEEQLLRTVHKRPL